MSKVVLSANGKFVGNALVSDLLCWDGWWLILWWNFEWFGVNFPSLGSKIFDLRFTSRWFVNSMSIFHHWDQNSKVLGTLPGVFRIVARFLVGFSSGLVKTIKFKSSFEDTNSKKRFYESHKLLETLCHWLKY